MSCLCQICSKEPMKYRCPSCGIYSCSLQCSQAHKSKCTQQQPAAESIAKKNNIESEALDTHRETLESLIADTEVQQLFQRYPRLRLQLRQIYHSTLEPDHENRLNEARRTDSSYRARGRGSQTHGRNDARRWTPDRGFARGLEYLRTQEQSESPSADGLKELSTLILRRYPVQRQQATFPAADV